MYFTRSVGKVVFVSIWWLLLSAMVAQCGFNLIWDAEVEIVSAEKDSEEIDDKIELFSKNLAKHVVQNTASLQSSKEIEDEELPQPPHLGTGTPPPKKEENFV